MRSRWRRRQQLLQPVPLLFDVLRRDSADHRYSWVGQVVCPPERSHQRHLTDTLHVQPHGDSVHIGDSLPYALLVSLCDGCDSALISFTHCVGCYVDPFLLDLTVSHSDDRDPDPFLHVVWKPIALSVS